MILKSLELFGFKSFAKKTALVFDTPITAIVGPNGSGKSNVAEAFRWVLGEQSLKSLRGKRGEDLIFNGGGGSSRMGQAGVNITFDNHGRQFNVDFDEVVIGRQVFRDGVNEYSINGSKVRLRDIIELLSGVSLGVSGHHIISQGEADRLLSASIYERKSMVEEALGLKIYRWKILESEKKLAKTADNIKQVESLRREIAPHLKFLAKQVEKVQKADEMRRALKTQALDYLKREHLYLYQEQKLLTHEEAAPRAALVSTEKRLAEIDTVMAGGDTDNAKLGQLADLDRRLRTLRSEQAELTRHIGRLEGMIEIKESTPVSSDQESSVAYSEAEQLATTITQLASEAENSESLPTIKALLQKIKSALNNFLQSYRPAKATNDQESDLAKIKQEQAELEQKNHELATEETKLLSDQTTIKAQLEQAKEATRGAERELFELRARRSELKSQLESLSARQSNVTLGLSRLKEETAEIAALTDQEVKDYMHYSQAQADLTEDRSAQEKRRHEIEKLKIRLEDMGIEGTDVLEEYKQTTERDEYLAKELIDLEQTASSLKEVMTDLTAKIDISFKEGITKINLAFKNYFSLLFDGGSAHLEVIKEAAKKRSDTDLNFDEEAMAEAVDEDESNNKGEARQGIDVSVSLPRKKIKGLEMLSGGERALTSIALLFAMSQVNPPPFLILDETDAALDEANSKKYGDMVQNLAKQTQLILISHNRETMSHAGVLYGVTMGAEGISKILSLRFEEASTYAK